jgi:hypothetical protein
VKLSTLCTAALVCNGCGLQLTSGLADAAKRPSVHTAAVTLTTQATRESSPSLALSSAGTIDHGLGFRNLTLHAGYDWLVKPGWVALEGGGDLGGGEPLTRSYSRVGAYFGLSGGMRVRVTRGGDRERTFNLFYPTLELVFAPQLGFWGPAEGSRSPDPMFEYSLALGIRGAFASDLVAPRIGQQEDGEKREKAAPWREP